MKRSRLIQATVVLILSALTACLALLFRSSGCGPSSGFTTGERMIMSDGTARTYFLKIPENYDPLKPYPLIFGFHGASGDYRSFTEGYYDFQDVVG